MCDFEPISATLIVCGYSDEETEHITSTKVAEIVERFLCDNQNNTKLIVYRGPWGDFNICNYIPDEQMTAEDGVEGEWFFRDDSINLYEFLQIMDRAIVTNPDLHVSIKADCDTQQYTVWTQRLLERRATLNQLQHVRII